MSSGRLSAVLSLLLLPPLLGGGPAAAADNAASRPAGVAARHFPLSAASPSLPTPPSFGERLQSRMQREAARHPELAAPPPAPFDDAEDPDALAGRGRRVERILTRALRRTLDDQLTEMARGTPAFASFFRWVDARGESESAGPKRDAGVAPAGDAAPGPPARLAADFGVRLDAHPRLQLRTRLGALTGSIEVPLLDPELRLSVEHPIGTVGRATVRGGHSSERGDWASFALTFGF